MLIQFKQDEIQKAMKQYITGQGINLSGKDIDFSFIAGRKNSGISVDVDITDASAVNVAKQVTTGETIREFETSEATTTEEAVETPAVETSEDSASIFGS